MTIPLRNPIPNGSLQPELRSTLLVGAIMVVVAAGLLLNEQFQWKRLPIRYPTAIGLIVFCSGVGLIAFVVIRGI